MFLTCSNALLTHRQATLHESDDHQRTRSALFTPAARWGGYRLNLFGNLREPSMTARRVGHPRPLEVLKYFQPRSQDFHHDCTVSATRTGVSARKSRGGELINLRPERNARL